MSLASQYLTHGSATYFATAAALDEAVAKVEAHGYRVFSVDASTRSKVTTALTAALGFQEQFGYSPWRGSLDALADALYGLAFSGVTGVVFAFCNVDASDDRTFVDNVLAVLDEASAEAKVQKRELMIFVHAAQDTV